MWALSERVRDQVQPQRVLMSCTRMVHAFRDQLQDYFASSLSWHVSALFATFTCDADLGSSSLNFCRATETYIFLTCLHSSPTQSFLLTYHPEGADSCTLTSLWGTPANRFGETRGTRWLQQRYTSVGKVKCAQQVVGAQTTNFCWKVEDCS